MLQLASANIFPDEFVKSIKEGGQNPLKIMKFSLKIVPDLWKSADDVRCKTHRALTDILYTYFGAL